MASKASQKAPPLSGKETPSKTKTSTAVHGRRIDPKIQELAVKYFLTKDRNYTRVAKHYDCSARSLKRWVTQQKDFVIKKYKIPPHQILQPGAKS